MNIIKRIDYTNGDFYYGWTKESRILDGKLKNDGRIFNGDAIWFKNISNCQNDKYWNGENGGLYIGRLINHKIICQRFLDKDELFKYYKELRDKDNFNINITYKELVDWYMKLPHNLLK